MKKSYSHRNLSRLLTGGTAMVMVSLMAAPVLAQQSTPAPAQPTAQSEDTVVVVGTRASQQSSMDRKRKAKTATDSIVAEDVGAFPDRNIGEAISRIAGVALDRGDYNEGSEVSLRGNGSGQTNVEIDGLGVQNNSTTNNLMGINASADSRGKSFQEFPADLIKSVDVVKGSTADMTEGGLGGSVIIKSRTGLDFKKPFLSFRYSASRNSLGEKWTPDMNLIASRKFFNNRLGLLLNITSATVQNDNNAIQPQTSGNAGLAGLIDFDNSPNKTFTFNPNTVSKADTTSTTAFANSTETPLSLVTKSAAAATKADCYTAFPIITGNSAAAQQRGFELTTCLNQWNDRTPSTIRYFVRRNTEERLNIDLRADYKVNDNLTVFAKIQSNKRKVDDQQLTYSLGGLNVNPLSVSTPTYNGRTYSDTTTNPITRSALAGSGYYLYPGLSIGSILASGTNNSQTLVNGIVANVNPASVTVDANHNVTKFAISDGTANTDQISNTNDYKTSYLSAGGTYQKDHLKAEFLYGDSKLDYTRYDKRTNLSYTYGPATFELVPGSGLWNITPGGSFNQSDPANYSIVRAPTANLAAVAAGSSNGFVTSATPAYTVAQQPWTGASVGLQWSPRAFETHETTAKIDVTYNIDERLPFITSFKAGYNRRELDQKGWGGGGLTVSQQDTRGGVYGTAGYIAPVSTPRALLRSTLRACEPKYGAAGTAAPTGALSCNYGYVPSSNISTSLEGVMTLNQADFQNIIGQVFEPAFNQFFKGYPDRGTLFDGWAQINVDKLYQLVSEASKDPKYAAGGDPMANYNFDCLKVCKGSDGKMYAQPLSMSTEKTTAGYFMTEFEQRIPWLPYDVKFNGNYGVRYVKTDVFGTGTLTLRSIRKTAAYNPAAPNAAAGIITIDAVRNVSFTDSTADWTPSFNGNIWAFDDKVALRYTYATVIARPPITRLLPQGTCTLDERIDVGTGDDYGCTTIGNPELKPYKSKNMNWSLEYYPNKDTQFSLSTFRNKVITGAPITRGATNNKLFAGSGIVDPQTGQSIENAEFTYTTFINGPGQVRRGVEVATKTAFTFLPWYFKYTGFDGNYAKLESSDSLAVFDLNTGTALPPTGESSYFYNASVWYDDGATNARLAVQARDKYFECIASCGTNALNNYPAEGTITRAPPYNPGSPNFVAKTLYIDFKVSHKFKGGVEAFWQMNNIKQEAKQKDQDKYSAYADGTPVLLDLGFPGYRITTGITIRR